MRSSPVGLEVLSEVIYWPNVLTGHMHFIDFIQNPKWHDYFLKLDVARPAIGPRMTGMRIWH